MKTGIALAIALTLAATGATTFAANASTSPANRSFAAADDNMTPYRDLATDTLKAFKAHDLVMARKKAKELETSWDKNEKALEKNSPEVWKQIDKAMDDFIKPLSDKAPDEAKIQAAYDVFVAKLKLAVK